MATQGILWVDVVLLGAMVATEDVGVYQVATRAVMACMIVITPLTASMAPRIAHHWETRRARSGQRTTTATSCAGPGGCRSSR